MRHFNRFCGQQLFLACTCAFFLLVAAGFAQTPKPKTSPPAVISYQDVSLKTVIKNLAAQLKLNVVFDETFRDEPKYDLELNDVALESALKIVLIHKHLMARVIEDKTIIIFHDNPTNRARFEEFPAWPVKYEQRR
ncbi:MAG TPA: hypothetical protein VFZ34_29610 [Blastocatellia bacterium]|nr:hypothetical protein [Blastocatellia bacterium]